MNYNAIINNTRSYGRVKDLILLFNIVMEGEIIWFKFLEISGMRTQKFRQICSSSMNTRTIFLEVRRPVICSWPLIYISCLG